MIKLDKSKLKVGVVYLITFMVRGRLRARNMTLVRVFEETQSTRECFGFESRGIALEHGAMSLLLTSEEFEAFR